MAPASTGAFCIASNGILDMLAFPAERQGRRMVTAATRRYGCTAIATVSELESVPERRDVPGHRGRLRADRHDSLQMPAYQS